MNNLNINLYSKYIINNIINNPSLLIKQFLKNSISINNNHNFKTVIALSNHKNSFHISTIILFWPYNRFIKFLIKINSNTRNS